MTASVRKKLYRLLTVLMIAALAAAGFLAAADLCDSIRASVTKENLKSLYPPRSAWIPFASAMAESIDVSKVSGEAVQYDGTEGRETAPAAAAEPGGNAAEEGRQSPLQSLLSSLFPESSSGVRKEENGTPEAKADAANDAPVPAEETLPAEPPEMQADFEALYEVNPDVVGWLTCGPDIDYPVVRRDLEFYLNHGFNRRKDVNGALFVNPIGNIWPRDPILMIHGHATRGRAMFGGLRRFLDENHLRQYPLVSFRTIYDADPVLYVPFAGFDASMNEDDRWYFDLLRNGYASEEDAEHYLSEVRSRSYWTVPFEVTADDPLLVLVTCSYINENGRFMLFCRQLREEETAEEVIFALNGESEETAP